MENVLPMKFDQVLKRLLHLSSVLPGMRAYRPIAIHLVQNAPAMLASEPPATSPLLMGLAWPSPDQLNSLLSRFMTEGVARSGQTSSFSGVRFVAQERHRAVRRIQFLGNQGLSREVGANSAAAYVQSVARQAQVPTRLANVHDFANALTWAAFPMSKWLIFCGLYDDYVEFFAKEAGQGCGGRGRGMRSDRLTNLDEAGVIALPDMCEVFLGHALLEHLLESRDSTIYAPYWSLPEGGQPQLAAEAAKHLPLPSKPLSSDYADRNPDARFADALGDLLRRSCLEPSRSPFVLEPRSAGC